MILSAHFHLLSPNTTLHLIVIRNAVRGRFMSWGKHLKVHQTSLNYGPSLDKGGSIELFPRDSRKARNV